jgi:hypothetical protein
MTTLMPSWTDRERVPVEYIGRARQLLLEVKAQVGARTAIGNAVIDKLKHRWDSRPRHRVRKEHLQTALHAWQQMPTFGRLRVEHELTKHGLAIAELWLVPGDLNADRWQNSQRELSLAIEIFSLHCDEKQFAIRFQCKCIFGLHALARRYQRSLYNDNQAIFADMAEVVRHYERVVAASDPDFTVRCVNGIWRGARTNATVNQQKRSQSVLSVRTFVDAVSMAA